MADIKTIIGDATKLMGVYRSGAVFTSSEQFFYELAAIANESMQALRQVHDWRILSTLKTQAGDGATTAFSLPSDYDRMPKDASVWLTSATAPLRMVQSFDEWMRLTLTSMTGPVGYWFVYGGYMNVIPAVAATTSIKYFYQSKNAVAASGGTAKDTFTVDTDTYRIDDRMLKLDMMWRWRSLKGFDYAQEKFNADQCFAIQAGNDKGSRVLAVGRPMPMGDTSLAYQGSLPTDPP